MESVIASPVKLQRKTTQTTSILLSEALNARH